MDSCLTDSFASVLPDNGHSGIRPERLVEASPEDAGHVHANMTIQRTHTPSIRANDQLEVGRVSHSISIPWRRCKHGPGLGHVSQASARPPCAYPGPGSRLAAVTDEASGKKTLAGRIQISKWPKQFWRKVHPHLRYVLLSSVDVHTTAEIIVSSLGWSGLR